MLLSTIKEKRSIVFHDCVRVEHKIESKIITLNSQRVIFDSDHVLWLTSLEIASASGIIHVKRGLLRFLKLKDDLKFIRIEHPMP
jgi:hypothetical protein